MGGKTKDRDEYQSISLNKSFVNLIKKHIEEKPQYRSIAEFVRTSVINQINKG